MPETIRIVAPTHDVAARLADALRECDVRVAELDAAWAVEVRCDREFNELLLHVLDEAQSYLGANPTAGLRLLVDGRSYPLHPPPGADGG